MGRIGEELQAEVIKHTGRDFEGVPRVRRSFFAGRPESAFMGAGVEDGARTREFLAWYRQLIATVPGMFPIATQASLFGRRIGGGRSVEVDLSGSDLLGLVRAGGALLGAVRENVPGAQVRPIPSLDEGATEYHVVPRREEAAQVGLTGQDLGLVVDALVDGAIIGEYARPGEPKVDVVLSAVAPRENGRQRGLTSRSDLSGAPVGTPVGQVVTLDSVARIRERIGPTVIRRIERSRALTLQVAPPDELPLERAMGLIRDEIVPQLRSEGAIPQEIEVELSGTAGQLESAKVRFRDVLLLAVLISFLLMAALFEDFVAPLAVMVTVPLAGAGGVIVLRLVDRFLGAQTLDMLTALGFVILIGVVVNNAILVVDGSVARLREGCGWQPVVRRSRGRRDSFGGLPYRALRGGIGAYRAPGGGGGRGGRPAGPEPGPDRESLHHSRPRFRGVGRVGGGDSGARQGDNGALQIPSRDRVCDGVAQDRVRQDSARCAPRGLLSREAGCASHPMPNLAKCVHASTDTRRTWVSGRGRACGEGAGGAGDGLCQFGYSAG